ncbi:MAG: DUF4214 domain-containing protein [Pyrinomonadaceae bacterium]
MNPKFRIQPTICGRRPMTKRLATLSTTVSAIALTSILLLVLNATSRRVESGSPAISRPTLINSKAAATVQAAGRGTPYFHFRDGREMEVAYRGDEGLATALRSGSTQSRALASMDFDRNGTPDLVAGFSYNGTGILTLQRGNPDAYTPKEEALYMRLKAGYNPDSLLPNAEVYSVPEAVDFLQVGDFNHDNQPDVLVAAQGGGMFLLPGDGRGGLGTAQAIALPGKVTCLTAGEFRAPDGWTDVAVGVSGAAGSELLVFDGADGIAGEAMRWSLTAPATAAEFGELDSTPFMGLAVAMGNQIEIVHGWGRKQSPSLSSRIETIDAGGNVRGLATGFFVWTREASQQVATINEAGTIRILQREQGNTEPFNDAELTLRARSRLSLKKTTVDVEALPGWQAADAQQWTTMREIVTGNVIGADATAQNVLQRTHVSFMSTDDLAVLGANQQRVDIVRQVDAKAGPQTNVVTTAGDMVVTSLSTSGSPATAMALPQKVNGERSLLVLQSGSAAPTVVPLAPTVTITVDLVTDPAVTTSGSGAAACTAAAGDCSFRGAVIFANANPGTVINLPTATHVMTINGTNGCVNESSTTGTQIGDVEVNQSTTFMGNGAANTIIRQGAATNDRVLCMNVPLAPGLTFGFTGMTFTGGRDVNSNVGGGGFIGGAKNTTLNLTDVTFANNQTTGPNISGGGGVAVTGGNMTVTNCTFGAANDPGASRNDLTLGNASNSNSAGGLSYSPGDPLGVGGATGTLTVTGTTFTHNTSSSGSGGGGGADFFNFNTSTGTANISTTGFSSNKATGTASGGGFNNESLTNVNVSTTSFTSNTAGNRGGGVYVGGGAVLLDGTSPSVTFTGNTAVSGGGSVSTAAVLNVSGTNTSIGGDIEVTTNGVWTNNAGSTLAPTNVLIVGGTFTCNNSTMNVGGNFTMQSGAVAGGAFNGNTGTVNLAGNFSYSTGPATPTFSAGTNTFNFNGSDAQSISNSASITFNNLTDSNTANPLTANNSFAVGGNLTVNASAIFDPVAAAVISGAGTLTGSGTARVRALTGFSPQYTITNKTLTNLTVEYIGAAAQTGSTINYGPLKINNASGVNLAAGTATVDGTLTLTNGALGVGTSTLVINNGTSVGAGSLTSSATGTVNYNQSGNGQSILAANYGNLTFSNFTKTLPNGGTIGIAGTFTTGATGGHTVTGSTVVFNGTSAQALPSNFTTYNNLTLNNAAGTTGFAGLTVNGLIRVQAGTFTSSSTYKDVQIDSGATLAATAASTINVSGSWTNNGGTFTPNTGTVNFNGSSAQVIGGTVGQTFNNLTVGNASGVTMNFDNTVNGVLALTSGDLSVAATKTLTQPNTASSSGTFDVNGRVQRTGFVTAGAALSFGNPFNTIQVTAGTAPANIVVDLTRSVPSGAQGFPTAVQRFYTITPSAGGFTGTLRLHYRDAELNGNNELSPNFTLRRFNGTGWAPVVPTSASDTTNNWLEKTGVTTFSPWTMSSCCPPTAGNSTVSGRITDGNGAPVTGAVVRLSGTQERKFITNADGFYRFDNVETNGFYTVTPARANYSFSPASRSFSQLGENTEATFAAAPASGGFVNPLDTPEYFVRQHYLDFLGREPDEAGFNFWSEQILECGSDQNCIDRRRENVSAAYFLSIEFQQTGGLIDGLYRAAYGVRPDFAAFMPDTRAVGAGVVVGNSGWEAQLQANKEAFVNAFVNRPAFVSVYGNMDNSQFVDTLISHTGVSFTTAERAALINGLANGTQTRADALRSIAENQRFIDAKFNEAFVMMEYFGYLRRDADADGYAFWLNKLNQFGGNFEQAEMVKAFIVSGEFRGRFPR